MKQLSGLDASFLYLETPEMPMHVGALSVYELPAGSKGRFVTTVRKHMAERLAVAPALRRRVWWMPLNVANPAWVDAVPDMRYHVAEHRLPKGSGQRELEALVARLHMVLLDRKHPLWKFNVIEGLAPGPEGQRRVAVYSQLHHAAVDGQAAVALANAILDTSPTPRPVPDKPSRRQKVFRLEMTEMVRGVISNQAERLLGIVRGLPGTVGTLKDAATHALAESSLFGGKSRPSNITLAPRTALNVSVTTARAFAGVTLPLQEMKELAHAHDATLNDMVLMVCSTALRRYFAKRRALPRKSLIAAVPITLRQQGDTTSDNQASMSAISLGTNIADPRRRLAHVKAAAAAMKSTMGPLKSILPTDFPSLGVPWLIEAAASLYGKAKVADRIPQLANVVISNVPGPPVPLYMAGALMLTNYPTSIIVHGVALNITLQSYNRSLDFGLMADAQAMPDVAELAEGIRIAFDDVRALSRPGDPDHDDGKPTESLVGRAQRTITGAVTGAVSGALQGTVGKVAQQVVSTALDTAVAQVTGRRRATPARKAAARR